MVTLDRARQIAKELAAVDRAVYAAIAITPTPALDVGLRRLSTVADHSKISLSIAGLLALCGGGPRRAALLGVGAIAAASASVNIVGKAVVRRPRPDREAAGVPPARQVAMPSSGSFPSGHSASAFAFASAVGSQLPWAGAPLFVLASAVAYSRVHTGVHYPADVVAGVVLGLAGANAAMGVERRLSAAKTMD